MPDKWAQYAQPAADPWAQYAQPSDPSQQNQQDIASRPGVPAAPNAINQAFPTPTLPASPGLMATMRSNWQSNTQPVAQSVAGAIHNYGGRAAKSFVNAGLHPLDTANGFLSSLPGINPITGEGSHGAGGALASDFSKTYAKDKALAFENLAGDATAAVLQGGALKGAAPRAQGALNSLGDTAQSAAESNLNRRMMVSPKDQAYGQNPARGILKSGIGTSTESGLIKKITGAKQATGNMLSNVVDRADANANAPTITPGQLRPFIDNPINEQSAVVQGPGNHAVNAEAPLDISRGKMTQKAPGATAPIYGPNAPGTVLPSDLWKTVQNIDKNTRFNPQPEVESVNEVNRDIRSGLRSQLETVDPAIKPISQNYGDLSAAQTAVERQASPFYAPKGLHAAIASTVDSFPVNSGASSALYKAGGYLKKLGGTQAGPGVTPFAPKIIPKPLQLESSVPGNAGASPNFSAGPIGSRGSVVTPPPVDLFRLPASTEGGPVQPMIGVKAPAPYPPLADEFARQRTVPNKFNGPPSNPFNLPKGLLQAPKVDLFKNANRAKVKK